MRKLFGRIHPAAGLKKAPCGAFFVNIQQAQQTQTRTQVQPYSPQTFFLTQWHFFT
jgi:hypothetical protein